MFTGLIEEIGTITNLNNSEISVKCNFANELKIGDSICVNGVCLTATTVNKNSFCANISPSSYNITNFRHKKNGDKVNLERAALVTSRLDGHLVYGHVDATANIISIEQNFDFYNICINIKAYIKFALKFHWDEMMAFHIHLSIRCCCKCAVLIITLTRIISKL